LWLDTEIQSTPLHDGIRTCSNNNLHINNIDYNNIYNNHKYYYHHNYDNHNNYHYNNSRPCLLQ